jgi:hypothetical protein
MPITQLLHITATYSNAVLVAVLPHISDCAKQLDLPIALPVTAGQVVRFNVMPHKDFAGGGLWLTNGYAFTFEWGYVDSFRSSANWFANQELEGVERFAGKDNMTTNDVIEFARSSFVKLGYNAADFHVNDHPTRLEGPYDTKKIGHVPYCRVVWESPEASTPEERAHSYNIRFDIDMQRKQVVGMFLSSTNFWRSDPKIDVVPELESDYRKRIQGHMFVRTNAIPHLPAVKPADAPATTPPE